MPTLELEEPFAANDSEQAALNQIEEVLNDSKSVPTLVGPDGERIELPQSVFQVLRQIIFYMMRGRAIFIVPENKQLTTQEAADILGVSRPYLIKLLDQRKIPYFKVGMHRRILFVDLMRYRKERDADRDKALEEIARVSQELGLYD